MISTSKNQYIVNWISQALKSNPKTFSELVQLLPGSDPISVFTTLSENQKIFSEEAQSLLSDAQLSRKTIHKTHDTPVPHPLDYDWRFNKQAIEEIVKLALRSVPKNGLIILLGVPTLLKPLQKRLMDCKVCLIDHNQIWADTLQGENIYTINIASDAVPAELLRKADLVIADPPWYHKSYQHFIWFSTQLMRLESTLVSAHL